MILHRYNVRNNSRNINIRPVGDLQLGDPGFNKGLWERWKRETLADKNSYIIGMGDYSNSFRTTIDKAIRRTLCDDNEAYSEFDAIIMREMRGLAKEFAPFKDRIIGLHTGHHKHEFLNGTNSDQYLCQLLGVKYLGFVAITRLTFRGGAKAGIPGAGGHNIDIFSTHGCGGAELVHSDLQNLERKIMPYWDADIFIRGHSTKAYCVDGFPLNRYVWNPNTGTPHLGFKKRLLCNSGGFMGGYIEGQTSYVEQKNMAPCGLGYCVVNVHLRKNNDVSINGAAFTE